MLTEQNKPAFEEAEFKEFREILKRTSLPSEIHSSLDQASGRIFYNCLSGSFLESQEAKEILCYISTRHSCTVIKSLAEERLIELFVNGLDNNKVSSLLTDKSSLITLKRVCRELTRNNSRKFHSRCSTDSSDFEFLPTRFKESNYFLKLLYAHSPLIKLNQEERALSRLQAKQTFRAHLSSNLKHIDSEEWSWATWQQKSADKSVDPRDALLRPELLHLINKDSKLFVNFGSRTLQGYIDESGIDLRALAVAQIKSREAPITVLDLGSYRSEALCGLKLELQNQVETHAVSMHVVPRFYSDYFWCCSADYLPDHFKQKFDLIISSRCLEYVALGHKALEGIAESLSIGGVADLQWRSGRVFSGKVTDRAAKLIKLVTPNKPSEKVIGILEAGMRTKTKNAMFAKYAVSQLNWTLDRIQKAEEFGIEPRLSIAWCEAVARLAEDSRFELEVCGSVMTGIGAVPGRIKLRRLSA